MNNVTSICLFLAFFFQFVQVTNGQSIVSTEEVLNAVKENNYDIKTARLNIASAQVLTTKENRGYLPTLNLNGGVGYSLDGVRTAFNFNFPDLNIQNIQAYSANIGVNSSYLIYDGGQRDLRNDRNIKNLDVANLQLDNIQQLLGFNAMQIYYSIAQATYNLELLSESFAISKDRLKRVNTYYQYGNVNKVDVLNAEVDVARDSVSLNSVKNDIVNLKLQLNQLTLREDTDYNVDTAFTLKYELNNVEELQQLMLTNNAELIVFKKQSELVDFDVALANKLNAPQLIANGGYTLNYTKNSSKSQLDFNRNNGLNLGLSANWNILDGGQQKVQKQLATIQKSTADVAYKNKENELIIQLNRLWNSYQNNLQNLRIELQNIQTNKANFEQVKTLYENGQQSSIEFRQAQLNLINAQSQYYFARISAKLSEVEIDYLLGK